jgi:hypothetical protein
MDAINELRSQLRDYIEHREDDPRMRTLMLQLLEADAVFISILFGAGREAAASRAYWSRNSEADAG